MATFSPDVWKYSARRIRAMPKQELLDRLGHTIEHHASHWHIPGYDRDDLLNEAVLVVLRCQNSYASGRGAMFPTYVDRAITHEFSKLLRKEGFKLENGKWVRRRPMHSDIDAIVEPSVEEPGFADTEATDRAAWLRKSLPTIQGHYADKLLADEDLPRRERVALRRAARFVPNEEVLA